MKTPLKLLLACAAATAGTAHAAECHITAEGPAVLVELYTSEGCSSCPPADRWLSALESTSAQGVRIIPLSLHVPYWDYIGWRDPFASPRFEKRQREAARLARTTLVYTPQVMVNGRDFRSWQRNGLEPALSAFANMPPRATLTLSARSASGAIDSEVSGSGPAGTRVVLVRYENGLANDVKRGENAGVRLEHDRVVRYWQDLGIIGANGQFAFRHTVPKNPEVRAERSGLTALIEDPARGEILQAVALPHCSG